MPENTQVFKVALRGEGILTSPRFNKGTAFNSRERKAFDLTGRLPFQVDTLDQQCDRAWVQFHQHDSPIQKNAFLQSLKAQNWVLHYALLSRHLREVIPIIYTPTEADAISEYSHLFRRSEGLYLSYPNTDTMEADFLAQLEGRNIELVVCSDAEAILGIGDQGVGGIGISTAKAVIYTLIGGIDPAKTLPVILDIGTNNEGLLNDDLYIGWPSKRITGQEYNNFVDKFVQLVRKHLPHALLHFEDFGVGNAQRLLTLYRGNHAVFNDDIQGTGAVTLAALLSAISITKSKLSDQRIVVYGAGSAGLGIAHQLRDAMMYLDSVSSQEASQKFWLIDKHGLITDQLKGKGFVREGLDDFVHSVPEFSSTFQTGSSTNEKSEQDSETTEIGLLDVVKRVKPTVLIGCSTNARGFTEEVVKAMKEHCERPIIFPLSNPSKLVEVDPKDANDWTDGMALIATGSPFPPVKGPKGKEYIIAECNSKFHAFSPVIANFIELPDALIYPGIGLGSIVSRATKITDGMIIAGARRLGELSPALKDPDAALLPDFGESPQVNLEVAVAVAEKALEEGVANIDWDRTRIREEIEKRRWYPVYGEYEYDTQGDK